MKFKITFWIFVALICYMPVFGIFLPKTQFGQGIPDIGPVRLFSFLLVIVFLIEMAVLKKIKIISRWAIYILLLLTIGALSISWSPWYSYNTTTIQQIFNIYFIPFVVALVALNLFTQEYTICKFFKHITWSAVILSLVAIAEFIFLKTNILGYQRSSGTFNNPNTLAVYLVLCIPCIIMVYEKGHLKKPVFFMDTLIVGLGVLSTVSRKGIITMVMCFLLYSLLKRRVKLFFMLIVIFFILFIPIASYQVISERFAESEFERVLEGKLTVAGKIASAFCESPIIGNGYNAAYERFGELVRGHRQDKYDAHNEFVTIMVNYGFIGFLPFLLIFLDPLMKSIRYLYMSRSPFNIKFLRDISVVVASAMVPFMFSCFFAGALFHQQVVVSLFYAIVATIYIDPLYLLEKKAVRS